MIETLIGVVLVIEAIAAIVIVVLNVREVRFLRSLRPFLPPGEYLPLFDVLYSRAIIVSSIGTYLLILTGIAAAGYSVALAFPLLRPINGLLFLLLMAGPAIIGRSMRQIRRNPIDPVP